MRIADGLLPELDPPSLLSGFGAGLTVVVIGGFFWSLAQMMTGMALTWVPMLSMGCIVGIAVGKGGRGSDYRFGLLGMALAVLGCFTGDFFARGPALIGQLGGLPCKPFHPVGLWLIFRDQAHWSDAVIYGTAALEGYHFALRRSVFGLSGREPGVPPTRQRRVAAGAFLGIFALVAGLLFLNVHRRTILDMALTENGQTLAVAIAGMDTSMQASVVFWNPGTG